MFSPFLTFPLQLQWHFTDHIVKIQCVWAKHSLWILSPDRVNFCKTTMDFSIPVLCLAPLFEFRDCSSTDCGLEWSGFEELSLCYRHPVFDPQVITVPLPSAPSSFPSQTVVGTEKEVAGGHRPQEGWQPLPVEWRTCEPWMIFFDMALVCRVRRNVVMTAVIAVVSITPHPNSSPDIEDERDRASGATCIQKVTLRQRPLQEKQSWFKLHSPFCVLVTCVALSLVLPLSARCSHHSDFVPDYRKTRALLIV